MATGETMLPALAREVFAYLLAPEEAFIYARLLPDDKFLQNLSQNVTLQQSAEFAARAGWIEGLKCFEHKELNLEQLMQCAASGGHIAAMELLKSWGAEDFNLTLSGAASGGHIAAMELLKAWGADMFNWALHEAASGGHVAAMELLIVWGADDFIEALTFAAEYGRIEAMKLAKRHLDLAGKSDWSERALYGAAKGGHILAMELVKSWGVMNLNWAFTGAACANQTAAMSLLKSWGADDFDWALTHAVTYKDNTNAIQLLRSWGACYDLD